MLLGDGDGSFSAPIFGNAGFNRPIYSEAVGDFNGDGKLDLVMFGRCLRRDPGAAGRWPGSSQPVGVAPGVSLEACRSMVVGDVNGDGRLDLVMASGYDVGVCWATAGVDSTFYPATYAAGSDPISVALGDFDRDGRLDIVTANADSNDVSILRGLGDGTFSAAENFAVGSGRLGDGRRLQRRRQSGRRRLRRLA